MAEAALLAALKAAEERARAAEDRARAAEEKVENYVKAASRKRAKHDFGSTNPLVFPVHLYNRQLLQINQPFLSFVWKPPSCDIVSKRKMRDSVVSHAMEKALLSPVVSMERLCGNELTHVALLLSLKSLTKPSEEAEEMTRKLEEDATFFEEEEDGKGHSDLSESEDEECAENDDNAKHSDDAADYVPEDVRLQRIPKDENEDDDDDNDDNDDDSWLSMDVNTEGTQKDFTVKVLDKRVYRHDEDAWVTVLVVEAKEPLTKNGIYQALCYACRDGLLNLERGRVAPIYVMQWSSGSWTYGLVDIYGAVKLENGIITEESLQDLSTQQACRWKYLHKTDEFSVSSRFTKKKLEASLTARRQLLRRKCSSNKLIDYPDDSYLVGEVFVDMQRFDLPNGTSVGRMFQADSYRFYEALMRIVIDCTDWRKEDVDDAWERRSKEMQRILEALLQGNKRRKLNKHD